MEKKIIPLGRGAHRSCFTKAIKDAECKRANADDGWLDRRRRTMWPAQNLQWEKKRESGELITI